MHTVLYLVTISIVNVGSIQNSVFSWMLCYCLWISWEKATPFHSVGFVKILLVLMTTTHF